MPRESIASKRTRAIEVANRMEEHYPAAECALTYWGDPFKLTVAVLLSAQTTDASVNKVTPVLWERFPTVADLASADLGEVESILRFIGLYRSKAKNCIACAQMVLSEYGGEVPRTMDELIRLPGVGRKTANIVLNEAFGIVEGIAVDTHVHRIARLLKFSNQTEALKCEQDLLKLYPREYWKPVNHQWILFGREICIARRPKCDRCFLADLCPSAGKATATSKPKPKTKTARTSKTAPSARTKAES
ncbi:MAG: endonuclease III [Berryella intestinalis]|uniref:endonuclease III n=1 Tax=Berryella intestinalis TaxID=1531429 RepID=UPI002A566081|nr:endonuclease III [Berryella intestinalis]MDD7369861.1 endonuclease III [Berryella intestinalis]MDY3129602.1 endonuclease III [Berryella intestinalis]